MSVYKSEKPDYLFKSLSSMINQSIPPNEIVIVKDGPLTKELDEIIEELRDERFIIVTLKENVGLGRALNIGLKECSNELIARMDSDDFSVVNRCEEQLNYLNFNPHVAILGTDVIEFEDTPKYKEYLKSLPHTFEEIKKFSIKRNPVCHPSVMFRKDKVLKVGGYKDCLLFEDYYLWIRALQSGEVIENVNKPLVYMRAGIEMYARRGGVKYVWRILSFRKKAYKLGHNSLLQAVLFSLPQVFVALLSKSLRTGFYKKILRRKNNPSDIKLVR